MDKPAGYVAWAAILDTWDPDDITFWADRLASLEGDTAGLEALIEARIYKLQETLRPPALHEQAKYAQVLGEVAGLEAAKVAAQSLLFAAESVRRQRSQQEQPNGSIRSSPR